MDAAPEDVFATLADPWMLPVWVVGATHIRGVDDDWPAPGSQVHHQVGAWPIAISDVTEVVESDPPRRLVLQARGYPLGEARIVLTVEADGTGSVVCMTEAANRGVARRFDNPLQRRFLSARNRESLDRLAAIAETRRPTPVESAQR